MSEGGCFAALLLWCPFLRCFINDYLFFFQGIEPLLLQTNSRVVSSTFMEDLRRSEILITEAYNPTKYADPEGFRLAMKLVEAGVAVRPLVIFRTLETEFLSSPHFIDYGRFLQLDQKLNGLLKQEKNNLQAFVNLSRNRPELLKVPMHRRIVR
jgi:hypothetical protein